MNNSLKGLGITAWMALGFLWMALGLFGHAGIARAAEQEFSGEVARVGPYANQMILNVPDGQSAEGSQVTVLVDKHTQLQGVQKLSELKQGVPVKVEAKKGWFSRQWIAKRLIYAPSASLERIPSEGQTGSSPTEVAQLHDAENKFAQGQMGDIEFETKRQVLEK